MKNFALTTAISAAVVLSGCSKTDPVVVPPVEFGDPTEIYINVEPEKGTRSTETGSNEENKISWLEFYVFDEFGNPDPETGRVSETVDGKGYVKINGGELTHKISVSAGERKKFLVLANSSIGEPAADYATFDGLKKKIAAGEFTGASGSGHNTREIPLTGFEMSGTTTATVKEGVGNNQVFISLGRLVSKINAPVVVEDIEVDLTQLKQIEAIWGEGTAVELTDLIEFEFTGYALVNGVTRSNISFSGNDAGDWKRPKALPWDKWYDHTRTRIGSTFNGQGFYTNNYSGQQGTNWLLDGTETEDAHRVYVYESAPQETTVNGVLGYSLKSVYAYIIEGKLTTAKEAPATRYWRVDLTKDDIFHIMRNCVYKVEIRKITTPGYGTPKEAEEIPGIVPGPDETAADFYISVDPWEIKEYVTEM